MSSRNPLVAVVLASVAFSSLALVGRVMAASPATCTMDAECPRGFTCQPWAVVGSAPTCAPDSPNCAVSTDNPPAGTGGAGGVTGSSGASGAGAVTGTDVGTGNVSGTTPSTTVVSRCAPGPCQTDSDCGADMVCHTESYSECSGGAASAPCEPGTKCEATVVTEPTCTTKTTSTCAFHWQLPCNADADCGAGFSCQPQVFGTCSGGSAVTGGGTSSVSGGTGVPASDGQSVSSPPDDCTTTTTFPGWCQPVDTICNVDADCPANWVCQDVGTAPSRGVASGAGAASGSGDVASGTSAPAAESAATGGAAGGTTTSSRMCVSPFIPPVMGADKGTGEGAGTGTPTSGSNPPSGTTGSGGTTGLTGTDGTNGPARAGDFAGAPHDGGGCSVSGSDGGSQVGAGLVTLAFLSLPLGLGLVIRRRRR